MSTFLSVIIASYNGSNYLSNCINALHTQNINMEIIVIDDSSTDDSVKIAQNLGCIVHIIPHSGQATARNVGITLAQGNFIMFHDQDDILQPDILHYMIEKLSYDTSIAGVMGQAKDFISPELPLNSTINIIQRQNPYFGFLGATVFRKNILDTIGYFSTDLKAGEATDFLLRIKSSGLHLLYLPIVVINRRIHNTNTSRLLRKVQFKEYATSLRKQLTTHSTQL